MDRDQLRSIVESLLFLSEASLSLDRLSSLIGGVENGEIKLVLEELQSEYESKRRGFRLVVVAGDYQLRTPTENSEWVKNLFRGKATRMSRATLETLAIIAYKQPMTRGEIEQIRGVNVDGIVSTLFERQLVSIVGRKDIPGKPFLYGTTREFLELFNLKDLTELPTLKEMDEITLPEVPEQNILPIEDDDDQAKSDNDSTETDDHSEKTEG